MTIGTQMAATRLTAAEMVGKTRLGAPVMVPYPKGEWAAKNNSLAQRAATAK